MVTLTHTEDQKRIVVRAPYSTLFNEYASGLRGKFSRLEKQWSFSVRALPRVIAALETVYGESGTPVERVTVEVTLVDVPAVQSLSLLGRPVAWQRSRDLPPVMCLNVMVAEGKFASKKCGSTNHPMLMMASDCERIVLLMHDVPRAFAEAQAAQDGRLRVLEVGEDVSPDLTTTDAEKAATQALAAVDACWWPRVVEQARKVQQARLESLSGGTS